MTGSNWIGLKITGFGFSSFMILVALYTCMEYYRVVERIKIEYVQNINKLKTDACTIDAVKSKAGMSNICSMAQEFVNIPIWIHAMEEVIRQNRIFSFENLETDIRWIIRLIPIFAILGIIMFLVCGKDILRHLDSKKELLPSNSSVPKMIKHQ